MGRPDTRPKAVAASYELGAEPHARIRHSDSEGTGIAVVSCRPGDEDSDRRGSLLAHPVAEVHHDSSEGRAALPLDEEADQAASRRDQTVPFRQGPVCDEYEKEAEDIGGLKVVVCEGDCEISAAEDPCVAPDVAGVSGYRSSPSREEVV